MRGAPPLATPVLAAVLAAVLAGCGGRAAPDPPPRRGLDGLAEHLAIELARLDRAGDRTAAARVLVASWRVPEATWPALVSRTYAGAFAGYAAAFDRAAPDLAAELAGVRGAIAVRWQYADDPRLTGAQVRARMALPDGRPGVVAVVGGHPLPTVFAFDGRGWRALTGADDLTIAAIAAADAGCARVYAQVHAGTCLAVAGPAARGALAGDRAGLARACALLHVNGCDEASAPAPHGSVAADPHEPPDVPPAPHRQPRRGRGPDRPRL